MKIKISKATIVDNRHPLNGKVRDILIEDGKITSISENITDSADVEISEKDLCVSIGWMDMRANFRDPGDEIKEDIQSGLKAAANGGFTAVATSPQTNPPIDSKGQVKYLLGSASDSLVNLYPIGTVSQGCLGKSLSEMYDMHLAGAVGFGDGKHSISESGLLQRALLYCKNFNAAVMQFPYDETLSPNGQMNEGALSTSLGLKGIPTISEEMEVRRDLTIADYTGGRLHLGPLSTAKSIDLVASAKADGVHVTAEVAASHLAFNESALENFNSFYKVIPPLRSVSNQSALIERLEAGEIDVISSDHSPEDEEHKKLEFDFASFGQANVETFFPMIWNNCEGKVSIDRLVSTFTLGPRDVLNIAPPEIEEGQDAELTLFTLSGETQVNRSKMHTKAYNTLSEGVTMKGRVIGIVAKGQFRASSL